LPAFVDAKRSRHTVARAQKVYAEIALEEAVLAETYRSIVVETAPVYRVEEDDR
jgi:hypothetical protein